MLRQPITYRNLRALSTHLINSASSSKRQICIKSAALTHRRTQAILKYSQPVRSILSYGTSAQFPPYRRASKLENHVADVKSYTTANLIPKSNEKSDEDDIDMTKSIRSELMTIKETFSMKEVPRDSLYIGAAGILPYAATSCSTVYLAWEVNLAEESGSGYLLSPEAAQQVLDIITPIQIGYGAIIISFLGAVHWGLEYAGFGGRHSYRRLRFGVIAPVIAWPTLLMPVETALITQFLAFNYMYFVDARATVKGWFPPWYSIYRFVLTFFVGASIVVSLISRGQIVRPEQHHLKFLKDQLRSEREAQFVNLESEETSKSEARMQVEEETDNVEEEEDNGEDED